MSTTRSSDISRKNILPGRTRSATRALQSAAQESSLILNKTEGTYFSYTGDYQSQLRDRFSNTSHRWSRPWSRTDKIVFVPPHLNVYVQKTYQSVASREWFLQPKE